MRIVSKKTRAKISRELLYGFIKEESFSGVIERLATKYDVPIATIKNIVLPFEVDLKKHGIQPENKSQVNM